MILVSILSMLPIIKVLAFTFHKQVVWFLLNKSIILLILNIFNIWGECFKVSLFRWLKHICLRRCIFRPETLHSQLLLFSLVDLIFVFGIARQVFVNMRFSLVLDRKRSFFVISLTVRFLLIVEFILLLLKFQVVLQSLQLVERQLLDAHRWPAVVLVFLFWQFALRLLGVRVISIVSLDFNIQVGLRLAIDVLRLSIDQHLLLFVKVQLLKVAVWLFARRHVNLLWNEPFAFTLLVVHQLSVLIHVL